MKVPEVSTDKTFVRAASDVIARQLGDSAVLIRMRTNRIYELNGTGARIWELLRDGATRDSVVDSLVREFHIEAHHAREAVTELADMLHAEGLLS